MLRGDEVRGEKGGEGERRVMTESAVSVPGALRMLRQSTEGCIHFIRR